MREGRREGRERSVGNRLLVHVPARGQRRAARLRAATRWRDGGRRRPEGRGGAAEAREIAAGGRANERGAVRAGDAWYIRVAPSVRKLSREMGWEAGRGCQYRRRCMCCWRQRPA